MNNGKTPSTRFQQWLERVRRSQAIRIQAACLGGMLLTQWPASAPAEQTPLAWPDGQSPQASSPTLERLQQLHKAQQEQKALENSKWRTFTWQDRPSWTFFPSGYKDDCEFYWPGWKLGPDGIRTTNVRSCSSRKWVAVDCKKLRLSWGTPSTETDIQKRKDNPISWGQWLIPTINTVSGTQEGMMVAALCDNISPAIGSAINSSPSPLSSQSDASSLFIPGNSSPSTPTSRPSRKLVNLGVEGVKILGLLQRMGVEATIAKVCPKAGAHAGYSRFDNLLVLCDSALYDPAIATESIAHEAVHALQDCIQPGGIKGSASIPLIKFLVIINGKQKIEEFKRLLHSGLINRPKVVADLREQKKNLLPEMFSMEYEASALEAYPKRVAAMLQEIGLPLCAVPD